MRLNWNKFTIIYLLAHVCLSTEGKAIFPDENIYQDEHTNITMWCTDDDSETISFFNASKEFPKEMMRIVNETTIELNLVNLEPQETLITCKKNKAIGVDVLRITIGTQPKRIEDFHCYSYDFQYMECNFTKPLNYLTVKYNLTFQVGTSLYVCPNESKDKNLFLCNLTLASGRYRQVRNEHLFTLHAKNRLAEANFDYLIKQFDNVIPGKPIYKVSNIDTNSAVLEWDVRHTLYCTDTGLIFNIAIQSQHTKQWQDLNTSKIGNTTLTKFSYKLIDLDAFTWYDVKLRLKVANSKDSPEMWTETIFAFQTKSKKPDSPPTVDVGSFLPPVVYHNATTMKFTIYWRGLPKNKENAKGLQYVIKEVRRNNEIVDDVRPIEDLTDYSAKFIAEKADYQFTIHSINDKGISQAGAELIVPMQAYPHPSQIYKIYKKSSYILRWKEPEPKDSLQLKDFTVFSCISKSETNDECQSDFNFVHVPKDTRDFTYNTTNIMNFAISANYFNGVSSGLTWTKCTGSESSDFGVINLKGVAKNGTHVLIEWNIECPYQGLFEGFRLKYCPMQPSQNNCTTDMKTLIISSDLKEYLLGNLKPYTTYGIWMTMFSNTKLGLENSNPLSITTLESAPSPPRNLTVVNMTTNTISLQWLDPEFYNGVIKGYRIVYINSRNEKSSMEIKGENRKKSSESKVITATLGGLQSYAFYDVFVVASTDKESEPSNRLHVSTKIGVPGTSLQPVLHKKDDDSVMEITWSRPENPGGPIDYYEIKTEVHEGNNVLKQIARVKNTTCTIHTQSKLVCQKNWNEFRFYVRAVNLVRAKPNEEINDDLDNSDDSNQSLTIQSFFHCIEEKSYEPNWEGVRYLRSNWSAAIANHCQHDQASSPTITIVFSIVAFMVLMISFYFGSKKFIKMKDIGIAFPPGLTDFDPKPTTNGCENTISREDIRNSDESLYKNENHKLLDSHLIDSGYMVNGLDCTDKSITGEFADDSSSVGVIRGGDDSSSQHAESVEMSDMSDSVSRSSQTDSPNGNSCENISPTPLLQRPPIMKPMIINGYVQHDSFQAINNEPRIPYMSIEAMEKTLQAEKEAAGNNKVSNAANAQENICGYVTHKQLSEFGHRQQ